MAANSSTPVRLWRALLFVLLLAAAWLLWSGLYKPLLLALGLFSAMTLFFKNYSFWSKPDSIMVMLAADVPAGPAMQTQSVGW